MTIHHLSLFFSTQGLGVVFGVVGWYHVDDRGGYVYAWKSGCKVLVGYRCPGPVYIGSDADGDVGQGLDGILTHTVTLCFCLVMSCLVLVLLLSCSCLVVVVVVVVVVSCPVTLRGAFQVLQVLQVLQV